MTMHLLPAFFSTTNTKKRKAKKVNQASVEKHDAWLIKMGCHPKQIKAKRKVDNNWPSTYNENMKVQEAYQVSPDTFGDSNSCVKRGVLANLHKEPSDVQKEILDKANRIQPLYNKGGLQYVTDGIDLHDVGKKK